MLQSDKLRAHAHTNLEFTCTFCGFSVAGVDKSALLTREDYYWVPDHTKKKRITPVI